MPMPLLREIGTAFTQIFSIDSSNCIATKDKLALNGLWLWYGTTSHVGDPFRHGSRSFKTMCMCPRA